MYSFLFHEKDEDNQQGKTRKQEQGKNYKNRGA